MAKEDTKPTEDEKRPEDLPLEPGEESPAKPPLPVPELSTEDAELSEPPELTEPSEPAELPEPSIKAPEPLDLPVGVQDSLPSDTEMEKFSYPELELVPESAEQAESPPELEEYALEPTEAPEVAPEDAEPSPAEQPDVAPDDTEPPGAEPDLSLEAMPQDLDEGTVGLEPLPDELLERPVEEQQQAAPQLPQGDLSLKGRYAAREAAGGDKAGLEPLTRAAPGYEPGTFARQQLPPPDEHRGFDFEDQAPAQAADDLDNFDFEDQAPGAPAAAQAPDMPGGDLGELTTSMQMLATKADEAIGLLQDILEKVGSKFG